VAKNGRETATARPPRRAARGMGPWIGCLFLAGISGTARQTLEAATPAPAPVPLQQRWVSLRQAMLPFTYRVTRDEVVPSETDPRLRLRRIDVRFSSQTAGTAKLSMDHDAVILMPADPALHRAPERRGKVVVVTNRMGDMSVLYNYAEPIAARTGYPTMMLPNPGEYEGHDGESCWIYYLASEVADRKDPADHNYFRLAIPYIRALDVFAGVLGIAPEEVRGVIGGHSKRATSAFTAAGMDPDRIVGVVYMGNESTWNETPDVSPSSVMAPIHTQDEVKAKLLYIGATNEGGYQMFNVNRILGAMKRPWTVEYVPNYEHGSDSEVQALTWQMWVAHVFDGRPLTTIGDLSHEETVEGTIFRAHIDSPNRIIHARAWYTYTDDPYWRDLMWYSVDLERKGDRYQGFLEGQLPDAWLVEVKDTAGGFRGYVSTLPQDLTGKETRRRSGGGLPRLWKLKVPAPAQAAPSTSASAPEIWERLRRTLPAPAYEVRRDETIASPTVPGLSLRRLELRFRSQTVGRFRRRMDHTVVLHVPLPSGPPATGPAKVVVVATRFGDKAAEKVHGEPLAARTGYATMVLPVPGEYGGHDGETCWPYFLRTQVRESKDPADQARFRLGVAYLRALDVAARVLGVSDLRAVIGGEGPRALPALIAAAMDPERVAGVVYAAARTADATSVLEATPGLASKVAFVEPAQAAAAWARWAPRILDAPPPEASGVNATRPTSR
jgi:hypothetical protein